MLTCCMVHSQTGVELELTEKMALLEWLANNYKTFGEFIYPRHPLSSQNVLYFCILCSELLKISIEKIMVLFG